MRSRGQFGIARARMGLLVCLGFLTTTLISVDVWYLMRSDAKQRQTTPSANHAQPSKPPHESRPPTKARRRGPFAKDALPPPRSKPRASSVTPAPAAKSTNTSIGEKVSIWRKRDAFFIQRGALTSVIRNKCLDSGGMRWPNKRLKMVGCRDKVSGNQRFVLKDGLLTQPTQGNKRTVCAFASTVQVAGAPLVSMGACKNDNLDYSWRFEPVPSLRKQYGFVRSLGSGGGCLTKPPVGRQTDKNAPVVIQPCSGWCNQTWSFGESVTVPRNEQWKPRGNNGRGAGRILCWILTFPAASDTKASAVNLTWGRKCDHLLFMTTEHVDGLNTVKLDLWGPEGRSMLWTKSKLAWLYIYKHYRDKADWFVKADDDSYLAMDNLHNFLAQHDPDKPAHFGRLFIAGKNRYYSGGSGIVLSRGALKTLGENFNSSDDEKWAGSYHGTGPEDLLTSRSLKPLGIGAQESLDKLHRQLFMPMGIDYEYYAPKRDEKSWFYRYSKTAVAGAKCCSERWVAVHYVKSNEMYGIDQVEAMRCGMATTEWPHLAL